MNALAASGTEPRGRGDDGLSLIEMIVGVVVSSLVLIGIGTVIVNSWLAQNNVLSTSEATNRGQLVASAIERSMRNAEYFEVKASGSQLWVRTSFDDERHCQAFQIYDGVAATMRHATSLSSETWRPMLDATDYDRFIVNLKVPVAGAFTQKPPTGIGSVLEYDFEVVTESAPVQFSGEVSVRAVQAGNGGCW